MSSRHIDHDPAVFQTLECGVCGQRFDTLGEFGEHDDPEGQPCPGGRADA